MSSSDHKRDHVFAVLCERLGISSSAQQDHLRALINADDDMKKAFEQLEALCTGPMKALNTDELKITRKLGLDNDSARGQESLKEASMQLETIVGDDGRNATEDALAPLIDYNGERSKNMAAFRTYTSRILASIDKFSTLLETRQALSKSKAVALDTECSNMDNELKSLEEKFKRCLSISSNEDIVHLASNDPKLNAYAHLNIHRACRQARQAFTDTASPHDHILTKLQALGWELNPDTADNKALLSDARCCASELNTIYAEACSTGRAKPADASLARAIEEERRAIIQEIQSLWDEVVPVAHMAVEKEFLNPLLKVVEIDSDTNGLRTATISGYTSGVLRFMNQHLKTLADRIYVLIQHHKALFEAYQYAWFRSKGQSVLDLPKSKADTSYLTSHDASARSTFTDVLRDYLTEFGSAPIDVNVDNPVRSPDESAITKLQEFVVSREGKLSTMHEQMQELFEAAAKANLGNVEIGRAILSRRILADTILGPSVPHALYKDVEAEEAIRLMENEIEVVREVFDELNYSGAARAPDFVLQAYVKAQKRLAAKNSEGTFNHWEITSNPTCRACLRFAGFVARWKDA
ncbi:hypothetical protein DL764_000490 [Monosporascus ibericus]|uniref:Uncharacterized protein n=1 Tax=Monosporascus ibericus TaxID=155417 RepID=A0A4Q4TYG7_9PEZI|nr:hypothetical protein DL764_000490 [Monosporascus ibericus]